MSVLDLILLIVCAALGVYSWLAGVALERTITERKVSDVARIVAVYLAEHYQRQAAYWQREATARHDDVLRHVGAGE